MADVREFFPYDDIPENRHDLVKLFADFGSQLADQLPANSGREVCLRKLKDALGLAIESKDREGELPSGKPNPAVPPPLPPQPTPASEELARADTQPQTFVADEPEKASFGKTDPPKVKK